MYACFRNWTKDQPKGPLDLTSLGLAKVIFLFLQDNLFEWKMPLNVQLKEDLKLEERKNSISFNKKHSNVKK